MDGMMHMLKTEARAAKTGPMDENPWDKAWKPGGSTLKTFDAMDEEDETLGWFSKALPFRRQPDQPEV